MRSNGRSHCIYSSGGSAWPEMARGMQGLKFEPLSNRLDMLLWCVKPIPSTAFSGVAAPPAFDPENLPGGRLSARRSPRLAAQVRPLSFPIHDLGTQVGTG